MLYSCRAKNRTAPSTTHTASRSKLDLRREREEARNSLQFRGLLEQWEQQKRRDNTLFSHIDRTFRRERRFDEESGMVMDVTFLPDDLFDQLMDAIARPMSSPQLDTLTARPSPWQ